ncbi:MAG: AAA family ATPase [Bacteroidales bacterium]|nr:AAA family ATPase [Bacteroidales bacterium]
MFPRLLSDRLSRQRDFCLLGVTGVGKTTLVKQFGARFSNVIHLDLETATDRSIFQQHAGPDEILRAVSFIKGKEIRGKGTLLVLDEIARCRETILWLNDIRKPQSKKGQSPFIVAVSSILTPELIQLTREGDDPLPAISLYPFSFEEFLSAMDDQSALEAFREVPVPVYAHEKLLHFFHLYALIGGMPEIVSEYSKYRHLSGLKKLYEKTEEAFLQSIGEIDSGKKKKDLAREILQNTYPFAATRIRFNHFGNIDRGSRDVGQAFRILEQAFLLQLVYPVTSPLLPLKPDKSRFPRVQVADCGMVNYFSGIQKPMFQSQDMNVLFKGQIARQVVGQEILGTEKMDKTPPLNFWIREKVQSTAEVDFLVKYEDMAIPVEVKSGEPGRLRSLHQFVDLAPHPFAIQLHASKLGIHQVQTIKGKKFYLLSLPYFLAGKIREHLGGFKRLVEG